MVVGSPCALMVSASPLRKVSDVGTVAEFASEHAGHDVRLCCIEVVDVNYYAVADADGTLSTGWDVDDTYNVETRTTDAQCRTCGVIVADVDASAIVVTL